jgi:hypothetical protein
MRMEQPFHEIGQIFTGAAEMGFDISIFRSDAPAFEEILAVRAGRQQLVTDFLATATPELLAEERDNPWGGGDWRPSVWCRGRMIAVRVIRLDHVQLAMPAGGEAEAVAFYEGSSASPRFRSRIISHLAVAAGSRMGI